MANYYELDIKGKFWLPRVDDIDLHSHDGIDEEGNLIYSHSDQKCYLGSTTEWVKITTQYTEFPQNTKLLMGKFPLPTGWNIDLSYNNEDMTVMLGSTITSASGDWEILGAMDNHSHNHLGKTKGYAKKDGSSLETTNVIEGFTAIFYFGYLTNPSLIYHRHNISTGGEHAHSFDATWRWANIKYCVATRS